jgi:putative ABC transport system permease protein
VLGGLGVWSVTRVIVQQKIRSVAVLKCLGASSRQVLATYVLQVLWLAAGGSLLGVALAGAAIAAIPASLIALLGVERLALTPSAAVQGLAVGLLVSLLFALVPLLDVRRVKPLLLLREHSAATARQRTWHGWMAGAATGAALVLVAVWQAGSTEAGLYVTAGLAAVAGGLYLASRALVRLTAPLTRSPRFALRHAVLGLGRPGNQTRVLLMAVGLGCFFILAVRLLQGNLLGELTGQVGETTPDLVLIDVQPDQVDSVAALAAGVSRRPAQLMPLLRGRVAAVEGRLVNLPTREDVRRQGELTREFGMTYRSALEANERVVAGRFWSAPLETPTTADGADTEVSIEQDVNEDAQVEVGDLLHFDVAGHVLRARVTSIREVAWDDTQNGGFVFVLRPGPALDRMPQSFVGFLQVADSSDAVGAFQRALVTAHPNVTIIDVRDVLASIRDIVDNVALGVTAVGVLTLAGGILILVGAVAMTKFQRLYEAAIYRTLGASARMIATLVLVEYGTLGLLAGLLGAAGALGLSWALATFLFEIDWRPSPLLVAGGIGATAAAVALVGLAASADVVLRKPLATLRGE